MFQSSTVRRFVVQFATVMPLVTFPTVYKARAEEPTAIRFDFGEGEVRTGYQQVLPTQLYSDEIGYGFEPGSKLESLRGESDDWLTNDAYTNTGPFHFSVKLPEGNYLVSVVLGDPGGKSTTTVKAELRRLVLENLETETAQTVTRTFSVNVRTPQIAGGGQVRLKDREKDSEWWAWDDKLTLEFSGSRPCVCGIEIRPTDETTTLFLLGDSTVSDQPREPYASWGQMLPRFLNADIVVANYAQSGESLRSSRGAKRLEKVLSRLKSGDWVMIQFGHNDMKSIDAAAYKSDLKAYVSDIRKAGGKVVLVTQMHRRTFDGDKITNSHRDYPQAVREVSREENVPLIDLHAMSEILYEAWGPQNSVAAFSKPSDGTHHNNYGAYELAKCIVQGLRENQVELKDFVVDDFADFDPSQPDSVESFAVPSSPIEDAQKPDGN